MLQSRNKKAGMLLVGHGTRDQQGVDEFLDVANAIAVRLSNVAVEPGFLELSMPGIREAAARLVERGVTEIVVTPLLLFTAGHVKQDIPQAVANALRGFPDRKLHYATPLEFHEKILDASAQRFMDVFVDETAPRYDDVFLILVGRGSSDQTAMADMRRFTKHRLLRTTVGEAMTAFMDAATPSIDEALEAAATSSYGTIVVQPHLLFHGRLMRRLNEVVSVARGETPSKKWLVAKHLGATQFVIDAAVDRFLQALTREGV